ncbi:polysaccharide biosynthesis/export family protein [Planctomicrobium sp. SH664]|uniref:polysaccharide biosynthesis/export family protein n=1 Tax=Planctomicrobium sp. SH664 TaxID=3448125 RepID=UPI003F5BBEE8
MSTQFPSTRSANRFRAARVTCCGWGLCLIALLAPGCTALHPVRGVPAAYLPDQFYGPSRENKQTINLSLLERSPPDQYRVAAGDVLSIYIPRVLGKLPSDPNADPGIEPPINMPTSLADPPTIGYPWTVRDDNTLSLPQIPPLNVYNMTLHEVEQAIVRAYTVEHHILQPQEALVLVSLQRPRVHRVLVVRQEANTTVTANTGTGGINIGTSGRGTARVVTLKAYENDVLHALSMAEGADGLPGTNAKNEIYVIRRRQRPMGTYCPPQGISHPEIPPLTTPGQHGFPAPTPAQPQSWNPAQGHGIQQASHNQVIPPPYAAGQQSSVASQLTGHSFGTPVADPSFTPPPAPWNGSGHSLGNQTPAPVSNYGTLSGPASVADGSSLAPPLSWDALQNFDPTIDNPNVIKIPLRLSPGENPHITEDKITLYDGDIVFIDNRETEVFYTGGLLGGGQYSLPRDYDLRVLEAVSIAEGRANGGNLNKTIGGVSAMNHDVGNSASRLAIIRTLPNGKRVPIEVDLHRAMRYREENIIVQPGDVLILEYTCPEAIVATVQRYLLEGALIGIASTFWTSGGSR